MEHQFLFGAQMETTLLLLTRYEKRECYSTWSWIYSFRHEAQQDLEELCVMRQLMLMKIRWVCVSHFHKPKLLYLNIQNQHLIVTAKSGG